MNIEEELKLKYVWILFFVNEYLFLKKSIRYWEHLLAKK